MTEKGFRSRSVNSWLLGETLNGARRGDDRRRAGWRMTMRAAFWCWRTARSSTASRWRADGVAFGEAVFTTSMTGYQEVVTDPSFAEQIVCFTAPMVGNYGVAPSARESARARTRARR